MVSRNSSDACSVSRICQNPLRMSILHFTFGLALSSTVSIMFGIVPARGFNLLFICRYPIAILCQGRFSITFRHVFGDNEDMRVVLGVISFFRQLCCNIFGHLSVDFFGIFP